MKKIFPEEIKHKCITGMHFEINGEEGPAFIQKWTRGKKLPPESDVICLFKYCPVCGRMNDIPFKRLNLMDKVMI